MQAASLDGDPLLHMAARRGHVETLALLLDKGAAVNGARLDPTGAPTGAGFFPGTATMYTTLKRISAAAPESNATAQMGTPLLIARISTVR